MATYVTAQIWSNPALRAIAEREIPDAKFNEGHRFETEEEFIALAQGCDRAIVGFEILNDRVLEALPQLRTVAKYGAGYEKIDFDALIRHGVRFGYTPGANRLAVAELALCFMIASLRWVPSLNMAMRAGERPRFRNGNLLTGRVVGVHGCGNIGREVVRLLAPFRCEILACDLVDQSEFYRANGVTAVSFEDLLARSEVLTLHLPRTRATTRLYDAQALAKMRADAVLVNTCRGGIVDEAALLERLESGGLRAAAFDVFAVEPCENERLIGHRNMLATPHIGASADEIRVAMLEAALRGLTDNAVPRPGQYMM